MKVVIPGGSGQVGEVLAKAYYAQGHEVVVFSRSPQNRPWRVRSWNGETLGPWVEELDGADVVINLAGRTVNCRYSYRNRWQIISSRLRSVRAVEAAINSVPNPPKLWFQASTATIYAHSIDRAQDEATGVLGGFEREVPETWRFSIDVARSWEGVFEAARVSRTRKVLVRSAMTMSPDSGGIFDMLLWLVRLGLGGRAGSGQQYISWIHYLDFVSALNWIIEHESLEGVVNISSPTPVPNSDFMKLLREAWGAKFGLPATETMVEIGTWLLRTESELPLKSRRVVPGRLIESGFSFNYPEWGEAARNLCKSWREIRA